MFSEIPVLAPLVRGSRGSGGAGLIRFPVSFLFSEMSGYHKAPQPIRSLRCSISCRYNISLLSETGAQTTSVSLGSLSHHPGGTFLWYGRQLKRHLNSLLTVAYPYGYPTSSAIVYERKPKSARHLIVSISVSGIRNQNDCDDHRRIAPPTAPGVTV